MTPIHHPADELVEAYAAGGLDEGQRIAIATHLSFCSSCRRWARAMERVGGALLEASVPTPLRSDAYSLAQAKLSEAAHAKEGQPLISDAPGLPGFLRHAPFRNWRWVGPGVHVRPLDGVLGSTRVFLLRSAPGARMLQHSHSGAEMTCVLAGAFSHEKGRFGPGDFDFGDDEVEHQPIVEKEEACVSLVAMTGGLKLSGLLGRLIQPFVKL